MTWEEYVKGMIVLQDYFAAQPNDTQYKFIWQSMSSCTPELWKEIQANLIKTFSQTLANPFPIVHHFMMAKQEVQESKPEVPRYQMISHNEELPDQKFMEEFIDSLPPMFRKHRTKRGGEIESLGDIINAKEVK